MIEINLLPKELRKKKAKFKIPDITLVFLPMALGLIGILVVVQIILSTTIHVKGKTRARLRKEWNQILPQKRQIDAVKRDIKKIQSKVETIDQLMVKRTLWSRKLNDLSDSMISGVWLTRLSLGRKAGVSRPAAPSAGGPGGPGAAIPGRTVTGTYAVRCLNLEGSASGAYGDETATVARFIKSLKENKAFFNDFYEIELESMERKTIKDTEVMNFRIICYFKEAVE